MASFKPAYLIHGDDHGRIAERRARLRAMAENASGQSGVELFEGDACSAEAVAGALTAMTFALGRRFVIADGVERWKDADVAAVTAAMEGVDPETLTVAFFAREDSRVKAQRFAEVVNTAWSTAVPTVQMFIDVADNRLRFGDAASGCGLGAFLTG